MAFGAGAVNVKTAGFCANSMLVCCAVVLELVDAELVDAEVAASCPLQALKTKKMNTNASFVLDFKSSWAA